MLASSFLLLLLASSVLSQRPVSKSVPFLGCTELEYERNGEKFLSYVCAGKKGVCVLSYVKKCKMSDIGFIVSAAFRVIARGRAHPLRYYSTLDGACRHSLMDDCCNSGSGSNSGGEVGGGTDTGGDVQCGGESGWKEVVNIDMSNSAASCPQGFTAVTENNKKGCFRPSRSSANCASAYFDPEMTYDQVCGKILGYMIGYPRGFRYKTNGMDGPYVDGVSLTYKLGRNRQHIWTFATSQTDDVGHSYPCPCASSSTPSYASPPSFIGDNYFCESGWNYGYNSRVCVAYPGDVLWDGKQCGANPCCKTKNPPWFKTNLPVSTTSPLEVRICSSAAGKCYDTAITHLELYVK